MDILPNFRHPSAVFAIAAAVLFPGCGEKAADNALPPEEVRAEVPAFPDVNRLGGLPGPVYGSQETSAIHWQPWTKASLQMARDTNRLVLAVIALPQQPAFADIIDELSSDAATVDAINGTYVPILIDGDSVREMGLLTADLCAEIGSGPQLPLMVWMTPEGRPVGWRPLPSSGQGSAVDVFSQSHTIVARTWTDDPGYVSENSLRDQETRRLRMLERARSREVSNEPGADAQQALRQLTALYDPLSRTFDEAGGLFPTGALDVMAMGVTMENLPEDLRERCRRTLLLLLDDLLPSPMFDPLDGGVFNAKRGQSWAFPGFYRDCSSQARVVVSLLNAYGATGDRRALDRALGVLSHLEAGCRTEEGLFRMDAGVAGDIRHWLWWHEDVEELLSEEEIAVWMPATGMKMAGNLPPEVDPMREFLRGNAIAFAKSAVEISESSGLALADVTENIERARRKLLDAREKRLTKFSGGADANAVATFRMVSAYATAYRITGETAYRDRATQTLAKAREHFAQGPRLKTYAGTAADSLIAGRAFLYAIAMQAALDVGAVTLDREWLVWAGDLSSTVTEYFAADGHLRESLPSSDLTGLPVTDTVMLFDESTVGLLSMSVSRLEALGIPLVPSLKKLAGVLPVNALGSPIPYTDVIQAALMREFGVTYKLGENAPEDMKEAAKRSPLKGVNRRMSEATDPVGRSPKPGEVIRIEPGGEASPVKSASEIGVTSLP